MKPKLIIAFCLITRISFGQTLANGYYITNENDSVYTKIKLPTNLFTGFEPERLEYKVKSKAVDSTGFEKFTPGGLKEFGFDYKGESYLYHSMNLDKHRVRFFRAARSGTNIGGYYFVETGYRGAKKVAVRKDSSAFSVLSVNSTSMTRKGIKRKFADYYKGDEKAQSIIQAYSFSRVHVDLSVKTLLERMAASGTARN